MFQTRFFLLKLMFSHVSVYLHIVMCCWIKNCCDIPLSDMANYMYPYLLMFLRYSPGHMGEYCKSSIQKQVQDLQKAVEDGPVMRVIHSRS